MIPSLEIDEGMKTVYKCSWKMNASPPLSPSLSSISTSSTNSFCFTPNNNNSNNNTNLVEAHHSKQRSHGSHAETRQEVVEPDTKRFLHHEAEMKLRILFTAYEELVQQHANVAEEAVLGWHEAEREADVLRKQLEKEMMDKIRLENQIEKEMTDKVILKSQIDKEMTDKRRLEKLHTDELEARIKAEARVNLLQKQLELVEKEHAKCKLYRRNAFRKELIQCKTKGEVRVKADDPIDAPRGVKEWDHIIRDSEEGDQDFQVVERDGDCLSSTKFMCVHKNKSNSSSSSDFEDDVKLLDVFEDSMNSSKSWAFALISQLDHIKERRDGTPNLMDDFEEMEKLASLPLDQHLIPGLQDQLILKNQVNHDHNWGLLSRGISGKHCKGIQRNGDNESTRNICHEISSMIKLVRAENELNLSQLENLEMKAALSSIGKRLLVVLQTRCIHEENYEPQHDPQHHHQHYQQKYEQHPQQHHMFDKIRAVLEIISKYSATHFGGLIVESPEVRDITSWSPNAKSLSEPSDEVQEEVQELQGLYATQELFHAIHWVVVMLKKLPRTINLWRSSEFKTCIRCLIVLCDGILHENLDIHEFLEEIASALEWLIWQMLFPLEEDNIGKQHLSDKCTHGVD